MNLDDHSPLPLLATAAARDVRSGASFGTSRSKRSAWIERFAPTP